MIVIFINARVRFYVQMILLKHISIIYLVAFTCISRVLVKKVRKIPTFNPRPWIKAESGRLIDFFTEILGTLFSPHDINLTVKSKGATNWGLLIYLVALLKYH